MSETETSKTTQAPCCGPAGEGSGESFHCPMAEKFGTALGSPGLKIGLLFPGFLLVVIGILILIKPTVLVWLAGGLSILFGLMFLMMSILLGKFANSLKH